MKVPVPSLNHTVLGASLWHLATHPEDRRRLVAEPELSPTAIEELLRAYASVSVWRTVTQDTTVGEAAIASSTWASLME